MSAQTANSTEQIPTVIPGTRQPLKSQAKWKRLIIVLLAFIYIVSPLDLIPDFIPVIGWFLTKTCSTSRVERPWQRSSLRSRGDDCGQCSPYWSSLLYGSSALP